MKRPWHKQCPLLALALGLLGLSPVLAEDSIRLPGTILVPTVSDVEVIVEEMDYYAQTVGNEGDLMTARILCPAGKEAISGGFFSGLDTLAVNRSGPLMGSESSFQGRFDESLADGLYFEGHSNPAFDLAPKGWFVWLTRTNALFPGVDPAAWAFAVCANTEGLSTWIRSGETLDSHGETSEIVSTCGVSGTALSGGVGAQQLFSRQDDRGVLISLPTVRFTRAGPTDFGATITSAQSGEYAAPDSWLGFARNFDTSNTGARYTPKVAAVCMHNGVDNHFEDRVTSVVLRTNSYTGTVSCPLETDLAISGGFSSGISTNPVAASSFSGHSAGPIFDMEGAYIADQRSWSGANDVNGANLANRIVVTCLRHPDLISSFNFESGQLPGNE